VRRSVLRQRLLALIALAVALPLPFTGTASPLFLVPYTLVAVLLLAGQRPLRVLPPWVENLLAPLLLAAVVAAGGLRYGVLRPVTNLALLLAAVRLPGCASATRGWSVGGLLALVGVAGVASSTHPSLVVYLLALELLLLGAAARLGVVSLAEEGVATGPPAGGAGTAVIGVTVGLSVVVASVLFLLLPRLRSPFATAPFGGRAVSGFRDAVALHRIGDIKLSREVVLRVRFPAETGADPEWLRLAGSTVQHYRAGVWAQGRRVVRSLSGAAAGWTAVGARPPAGPVVEGRITIEQAGEALFMPPGATNLELPTVTVSEGPLGSLRVPRGTAPPVAYGVRFVPGWVNQPPPEAADVEVPPRLAWVRALAREAAAGSGTSRAAALFIEGYLRDNFTYSTRTDAPLRRDPVDWFLATSRQGHCEFFASSMVIMLRSLGIPARLQAGFAGGERDGEGGFVVRQSHAHAWVLAWVGSRPPGEGGLGSGDGEWEVFDPTPPEGQPAVSGSRTGIGLAATWERVEAFWDRWVLTFSLADQVDAVVALLDLAARRWRHLAGGAAVSGSLAVLVWGALRWRRRRQGRGEVPGIARLLRAAMEEGQRLGWGGGAPLTPRRWLAEAEARVPAVAADARALVAWHEATRYAGAAFPGGRGDRRAARRVVRALREVRPEPARGSAPRRRAPRQ